MTTKQLVTVCLLGGALTLGASCGGDDDGLECGPGTVEQDGLCVPADDGLTCAAGTVEQDGECVPDGSVICEQGTVFDADSGTCVVDADACANGTVLVDGECVPFDDTLVGDISEGVEPNDFSNPGSFTAPAVGETITIDGCVTPEDFDGDGLVDIDFDVWTFDTTEPALYDITIDGIGGLSAGFIVGPTDPALDADGWQRFGLNLVSDGAQRQVFTPRSGTFWIAVSDGRSIFLNSPAGDQDTCYFLQIERIAIPAATPITSATELGSASGDLGDPKFYSVSATADQQLLFDSLAASSSSAIGAVVQLVEDAYRNSGAANDGAITLPVADLTTGDSVVIVVDHVYNISLNPVPFTLTVTDAQAQPAGNATVTHDERDPAWFHFNAVEGDVLRFDFDGDTAVDGFNVAVFDTRLNPIAQPCNDCSSFDRWFLLRDAGTYYVAVFNLDGVADTDYDVAMTLTSVTPSAVTVGTPAAGDHLTANADFFLVDVQSEDWLSWTVTSGTDMDSPDVYLFDPNASGQLFSTVPEVNFQYATADTAFERVTAGDPRTYLVMVTDYYFDGSEEFELQVDQHAHGALGTVTEAAPISAMAGSVATDEVADYLVKAAPGTEVTVTVTGTGGFDTVLRRLDIKGVSASTFDSGVADEAETFTFTTDALGNVAFSVEGYTGAAGDFTIDVAAVDPAYTVAAVAAPFTDACQLGAVHALRPDGSFAADDEGLSATAVDLPFAFDHFGTAVTEFTVSTNGWLTFTDDYQGSAAFSAQDLPNASAPNALVAPFWRDLDDVQVCIAGGASGVIVQWRGRRYGYQYKVEFQVILRPDDTYEFVYGPNHSMHSGGTVGIENGDGTDGFQYGRANPTVVPGTSVLVSP